MAKIHNSLLDLIGGTPLVEVGRIEKELGLKDRVLVKMEAFNPGGSVKDRVAAAMIEDAEKRGVLKPGGIIVEPTSGNTGIGLAWVASIKGYKLILTMPETMSRERMSLLRALGAELILTPGAEGMKGAIAKANELLAENPGAWMPGQFDNPANPARHEATTAQEIWNDTDGKVDFFVAGVGTGGTLCGTGRGLKAHNPAIKVVGVEPSDSPVLSGGKPGPHKLQGIGAGFIPANYDPSVVDEVVTVTYPEAEAAARMLAKKEGILAGVSSGAAFHAAVEIARKPENEGKTIVVLLPDTGDRYLSTPLFG
ncbi:MAG: cysteine synthase A [Duncaniella sp.]|nr:cysteine synthase A [Duncaniella sp.]